MGFSLGANDLLKYVGQSKDNCLLTGVVAVSNPWDVSLVVKQVHKNWLFNRQTTRYLVENFEKYGGVLKQGPLIDGGRIPFAINKV